MPTQYVSCPKCGIGRLAPLRLQLLERRGEDTRERELELDQCGACEGIWFDAGELDDYLRNELTVADSHGVGLATPRAVDDKEIRCIRCFELMFKGAPRLFTGVVADICPKCGGVWLDPREIDRLEAGNVSVASKLCGLLKSLFRKDGERGWDVRVK